MVDETIKYIKKYKKEKDKTLFCFERVNYIGGACDKKFFDFLKEQQKTDEGICEWYFAWMIMDEIGNGNHHYLLILTGEENVYICPINANSKEEAEAFANKKSKIKKLKDYKRLLVEEKEYFQEEHHMN